jgi:hypothetical protein
MMINTHYTLKSLTTNSLIGGVVMTARDAHRLLDNIDPETAQLNTNKELSPNEILSIIRNKGSELDAIEFDDE